MGRRFRSMLQTPYSPVLTANVPTDRHGALYIRPVSLTFRSRHDVPDYFESDSAPATLARLRAAAFARERVVHFAHGELEADADSVAALNSYLRTARAMGRMRLPWDRLPESGTHKYAWASFCQHLGLIFR